MVRQQVVLVIALALAAVALIVAVNAMDTERAAETVQPTTSMTAGVWVDLVDTAPVEYDPWEFVAMYRTAEDPLEVERMEEALLAHGYFRKPRTKIYYCHPYSAYERGSNENMNRIIRRFFPKGTNFDTITAAEVAQVEEWLANYPRRILGWKTPQMLFDEYMTVAA